LRTTGCDGESAAEHKHEFSVLSVWFTHYVAFIVIQHRAGTDIVQHALDRSRHRHSFSQELVVGYREFLFEHSRFGETSPARFDILSGGWGS
jgi:hypothetical protein